MLSCEKSWDTPGFDNLRQHVLCLTIQKHQQTCIAIISHFYRLTMLILAWVLRSVSCTRPESCLPRLCHGCKSPCCKLDSGPVFLEPALQLIWAGPCWKPQLVLGPEVLCPASLLAPQVERCWKVKKTHQFQLCWCFRADVLWLKGEFTLTRLLRKKKENVYFWHNLQPP